MNIKYINIEQITDINCIGKAFEDSIGNYVGVREEGQRKYYHIEEFCNNVDSEDVILEELITYDFEAEEEILLKRIKCLEEENIQRIREYLFSIDIKSYVCCSTMDHISKQIFDILLGSDINITCKKSVFDLAEGDKVIFLSYKQLKLYRKVHMAQIESFVVMNNIISDTLNKKTFEDKFIELQKYYESINVSFIYGIVPEASKMTNLTEKSTNRVRGFGRIDYDIYSEILGGKDSPDYISCMEQNQLSRVINNGIFRRLVDCTSKYYNVIGGLRVTCNQPEEYSNTIYMFEPCIVRGALVADCHTISSYIQKKINKKGYAYNVINCGVGGGSDLENTYKYILSMPIKPGDIILLIEEGQFLLDKLDVFSYVYNLSEAFNRKHIDTEWFIDRPAHCNKIANELIADELLTLIERINDKKAYENIDCKPNSYVWQKVQTFENGEELTEYISHIDGEKFVLDDKKSVGSIVMHCNPMTLGHKYLIDQALKMVDYLYVFILSEDQSEFSYKERKNMLIHEVENYKNVKVFDCGKFMGSIISFPEYFTKEMNKNFRIDASKDILTFCQYVAPTLGITKRFVGTEDRDFVTRQFNNQLKLILPYYGIELCEIERLKCEVGNVSAYKTRQLIRDKNWEMVKKMVPAYVYQRIRRLYEELPV